MPEEIVRVRLEADTTNVDQNLTRVRSEQQAVRKEQGKIYTEAIYTYTQIAQLGNILLRNLDLGRAGLIAQQVLVLAQLALTERRIAIESAAAFASGRPVAGAALAGLGVATALLYGEQQKQKAEAENFTSYTESVNIQMEQWS